MFRCFCIAVSSTQTQHRHTRTQVSELVSTQTVRAVVSAVFDLVCLVCLLQVSPEVLRELDHGAARDNRGSGAAQAMQVEFVVGKHVVEDVRNLPPVPMMDDE